ncbi:hypothetical protein C1645_750164, partial [Glomus cerebriforme]
MLNIFLINYWKVCIYQVRMYGFINFNAKLRVYYLLYFNNVNVSLFRLIKNTCMKKKIDADNKKSL